MFENVGRRRTDAGVTGILLAFGSGVLKIENLKKEGKMRISILIFIYTMHFAYLRVYTKFHNPKSSSCSVNIGTLLNQAVSQ